MKKLILSSLLAATIMISCKKSESDSPGPGSSTCTTVPDVSTNTDGDTSNAFFYMGNTSKIGKVQNYNEDGERDGYTIYTYDANKIIETFYSENGMAVSEGVEYHLDNTGKVIMQTYYEINTSSHDTVAYQYDSNGNNTYRIHKRVGTNTTTDTIVYAYISNYRVSEDVIKNGKSVASHAFEYSSSEDKVGFNTLANSLPGRTLFGNIGKTLVSKDTYTDNKDESNNYVATYTYVLDGKGYPVKVTYNAALSEGTSLSDVTNYTYVCR